MTKFIELTRVYVLKADKKKALKSQTITIAVDRIESVRASNRLGFPEHRATVMLSSGAVIDVADKYSVVRKAMGN